MSLNQSNIGLNDGSGSAFLAQVNSLIEQNLCNPRLSILYLCKVLCMSRMQLHRKLKAETCISASHYIRFCRLKAAKQLLLSTELTIAEIAYDVGFSSPSYFTRSFVAAHRMTPSEYRKGEILINGEKTDETQQQEITLPPIVTIVKGIVTQVQRRLAALI